MYISPSLSGIIEMMKLLAHVKKFGRKSHLREHFILFIIEKGIVCKKYRNRANMKIAKNQRDDGSRKCFI
jgi:hypothetical protein